MRIKWLRPDTWRNKKWIGIIHMKPKEFLNSVPSIKPDKGSMEYLKKILDDGGQLYMPEIGIDDNGLWVDHEGRHRATLAKQINEDKMPVAVYWYGGYRGSEKGKLILERLETGKYEQGDYIF